MLLPFICLDGLFHPQTAGASYCLPGHWASGRRRWFNSHVTLFAWQRHRGASGEGFTHTHAVTHGRVEAFRTRCFHLRCGLSLDTLVQTHSHGAAVD